MSDWVQRAQEAYQIQLAERNAEIARIQKEHFELLASTISWLLDEKHEPSEGYFVEPDSYRLKVVHPEHTVTFTLVGEDKFIGMIHVCNKCGEEYATLTRSPEELGEVLVEGAPWHVGCKGDSTDT